MGEGERVYIAATRTGSRALLTSMCRKNESLTPLCVGMLGLYGPRDHDRDRFRFWCDGE